VTGEHQKGRTMTCPCQKLFRRSHQEGTDDGARLACPLVSQESVVAWRETFKCPMAYAARRTGAVSTALGTSTSMGSWWPGRWGLGGLRSGTRTRSPRPRARMLGTDVIELSGVRDTISRRADRCASVGIQEA